MIAFEPALSTAGVLDLQPHILAPIFNDTNFRAIGKRVKGGRFFKRAIVNDGFGDDDDCRFNMGLIVKSGTGRAGQEEG